MSWVEYCVGVEFNVNDMAHLNHRVYLLDSSKVFNLIITSGNLQTGL